MKKVIGLVLLFAVAFSSITSIAAGNTVSISVNGEVMEFPDTQPFIDENNRVQIPIGALAKNLGIATEWDEDTQSAQLFMPNDPTDIRLRITIDKNEIEIGSMWENAFYPYYGTIEMDTVAVLKDNRTFIPIRYVEQLRNFWGWPDFIVEWDEAATSVNLRSTTSEIINNTGRDITVGKIFSGDEWRRNFLHNNVQYDDSFFEDNFLISVMSWGGWRDRDLEVASVVEKEDAIEVVMSPAIRPEEEYPRNVGPAVAIRYYDFIELDRSLSNKDISLVFVPREDQ